MHFHAHPPRMQEVAGDERNFQEQKVREAQVATPLLELYEFYPLPRAIPLGFTKNHCTYIIVCKCLYM